MLQRFIPREGIDAGVGNSNILTYLVSVCASVNLFVFVNASLPFLLTYVAKTEASTIGTVTGNLILVNEGCALIFVLVWGYLIDQFSIRFVTFLGHLISAVALVSMTYAGKPYPDLICLRIVYTIGESNLSTCITATLPLMTDTGPERSHPALESEADPLLSDQNARHVPATTSKLSAAVGFVGGLGALIAVFVFLRLPPLLAAASGIESERESLASGTRQTYYVVAGVEAAAAVVTYFGLNLKTPQDANDTAQKAKVSVSHQMSDLFIGFRLGWKDTQLGLAYFAGLAARSQTIIVSAFIPLFVNSYYVKNGKCGLDDPSAPTDEVKKACREAFVLSSSLTGSIQLVSLLSALLVGWFSARKAAQHLTLISYAFALGAFGFALLSLLNNPRHSWPAVPFLGLSQIAGVILTLSLIAACRARLSSGTKDRTGAISAAYSFYGGIGILATSQLSGILADKLPVAPFILAATLNLAVTIVAFVISRRQ